MRFWKRIGLTAALAGAGVVAGANLAGGTDEVPDRPRPDGGVGMPSGTREAATPPIQEAPSAPLAPGRPSLAPGPTRDTGNGSGGSLSDVPPPRPPLDEAATQSPLPAPPDKTTAPRGEVPLADPDPPKGGGARGIQDIKPNPVRPEIKPRATPDPDPRRTP